MHKNHSIKLNTVLIITKRYILSQILSLMLYKKKPFIFRLHSLQWLRLKNIHTDMLHIKIDFTLLQHIPKLLISNNLFNYSQLA